jgi:mono/diheme cytochrome c family protein
MMTMLRRRWYLALLVLGLALVPLVRATRHRHRVHHDRRQAAQARVVDYAHDIQPILAARCSSCHGPKRHKAGLRLDSPHWIRKGGDGGAVIIPGDSANSILIARVSGADGETRMPPTGAPLNPEQIALLRAWIDAGADAPAEKESEPADIRTPHWAFQAPLARPVPAVHNPEWAGNPIDAFLAAAQEAEGLTPSPPVVRDLLLRRVFIDLIGLPPTREQLLAFRVDTSPDAYEKIVDRLLASPQYGERWGRHWMDIWRYSDPDGRKAKQDIWWSNVHVWRWRDWIVQSLNRDKGYNRMIVEMLAGDELDPGDPDCLAATGFLVRNWFKLSRTIWLNNTVEHTSKAFLGLTIGCARCHDHKFDPISQKEYYQFRAFFEPHDIRTDPLPESDNAEAVVAHAYDAHPETPTWILIRGDEKRPDKSRSITPGIPAALGGSAVCIEPPDVSADWVPSTGRRLALARWLGDQQNPLTARVAVNHIWARHFGRPLVANVHDFGLRSKPPVQHALLDWLAVEFMNHGWSMKWLHRLMVTSTAYRMQSSLRGVSVANLAADPDNEYYWRMNPRRMEAEVVRDALLHLGGELDSTMGGLPLDCLAGPDFARRSLYHRYSREDKMVFLTAFDAPGVEECYRRQESIVPQQALALENSEFVWDQARRIARHLEKQVPPEAFVTAAFEHILGREPEPAECAVCERFLAEQERLLADPARLTPFPLPSPPAPVDPDMARKVPGLPLILSVGRHLPQVVPAADPQGRAREYLIHALLNHNDFITVR